MKKFLLLVVACCLMACSTPPQTPPTPFETGAVTAPPQGCVELRKQSSQADC